jgi:hypothetical protein
VSFRGSVDRLAAEGVSGWIYDTVAGRSVVVQALLHGRIIGEAIADIHRADLAAAGLGDGRCGFELAFFEPVDPTALPFIEIKPQGGDVELPRTNVNSFGDYFRTLFSRHPGAGRQRSVFGGLWTDRSDAQRLLQGRIASGATPAELVNTLRAFIGEGYVVLKSALAPVGVGPTELALIGTLEADKPLDPHADPAARQMLAEVPGWCFAMFRCGRSGLSSTTILSPIAP